MRMCRTCQHAKPFDSCAKALTHRDYTGHDCPDCSSLAMSRTRLCLQTTYANIGAQCGGSNTSKSDDQYFVDGIHLNKRVAPTLAVGFNGPGLGI